MLNDRLRRLVIMDVGVIGDQPEHRGDNGVDEELHLEPRPRRGAGLAPRDDFLHFMLAANAEGQNGEQHGPPDDHVDRETKGPVHSRLYHTSAVWTRTTGFLPQTSFAAR